MQKLVVHVPHASLEIPVDNWPDFIADRNAVKQEAYTSADLYTDILARSAWPEAEIFEAIVSRIVVDVERYEDDALEEMSAVGRGVIYTHNHRQELIRRSPGPDRREILLEKYYRPHWARLRETSVGATLIDLHSYPLEPWPVERHSGAKRPEIDIGFSKSITPDDWISDLTEHFMDAGYEVGHNSPYSGVIDAGADYAVMIEIRRDIIGEPGDDPKWIRLVKALKEMPLVFKR